MFRKNLGLAVQKKIFVMIFTSIIYIAGLVAYFSDKGVLISFLLLVISVFAIVKNYLSPKLVLFWYFLFFFGFFNANFRIKDFDSLSQIAPQDSVIEGRIVSIPSFSSNKISFFFDVSKINYNEQSRLLNTKTLVNIYSSNNKKANFNIGESYRLSGKLRKPFEASNPSQFDYGKYLKNYNVYTIFYANNTECSQIKEKIPLKWKFLQELNYIRNGILFTHSKYLKSPNLELLGGIVFGDDAVSTPEELKNSFKHSGLLHLLAASGMNVALIYGIWFFLLRYLKVPFRASVFSGIFIIILYTLMTGFGPSVIRAAFMLIFILLGKLIDRDAYSVSLLFFVALIMLIYNPAYINNVSFQLSFIVTFGLLVMTPILMEKTKKLPAWLSGALFVPIIAQIWVAPIQMYYFNSFSLYSVFANILILPFVTIVSFGGFISSVLALIKPLASEICLIFDFVLNPVLNVLVFISDYFAELPNSLISTVQPSAIQMIFYYIFVLLFILLFKIGINKKIILAICSVFAVLIFSFIKISDNSLETIFFDVKNADAALIKTPQGKYIIIDSGKMAYKGGKTQAQMVMLPYLRDRGIKNIECLIITHFDSDHSGGAVDLIKDLNIKIVYVNSLYNKSRLAREIYSASKSKLKLARNNEIIYKEKNLTIRNFIADVKNSESENENSIITLISDKDFDQLFMGDGGIIAFDKIKSYLPDNIEILKVGHHGAKNVLNQNLLSRIKPEVSIISTGLNNYNHPNVVTLDLLIKNNIKILRTDRQNAIKIVYKNNIFKTFSFVKDEFILLR